MASLWLVIAFELLMFASLTNVIPGAKSWLEGFNACYREKNASDVDYVYKLPENKTYIAEIVSIHGPLWTYGLEVILHQNGKTNVVQINRRNPSLPAVGVCSLESREPLMSIDPNRSYTEAQTACHKRNTSIPIVTPTNISLYANDILVRSTFWVASINEESYLNDQDIDVRCLLYDSNGDIKTDDCNSKHKTLCVTENAMPVVQYVANVTLPRLRTESSKGTSSGQYTTHGSKNTKDKKLSSSASSSSTPSSSSRTKLALMNIIPGAKSWLEGFDACNREKNASDVDYVYKLHENKTFIAELVSIHGPLWTYGLEVIFHQNGKTKAFQITERNPSLPATGVCSLEGREPLMSIDPNRSYSEAETACHKADTSIPIVTPKNITLYSSDIIARSSFWVASINEELYLNDKGIDVRCLLYDSNGDIKTDDCKSKHKTLCVKENAMPVVKYVANVTLPRLPTESSHGSKNTNDKKLSSLTSSSSTPSSSSRTKSDFNEAGANIGAIIGGVIGGIACVGLIILAVFCLCCRHRNTKDKKEGNIELQDKKDTEYEVKDDGSAYYNISKPAQYECLGGATGTSEYTSLSRPELGAVQSDEPAQYECLGEGTGSSVYTSLSQPELDVVQSGEPAQYECLDRRNSASV